MHVVSVFTLTAGLNLAFGRVDPTVLLQALLLKHLKAFSS